MICPNCYQSAAGLYQTAHGHPHGVVTHCGCYYEGQPDLVLAHVRDEVIPDMQRASGDCICTQCSRTYSRHPFATEWLDQDGNPYLNRLCDGRLVKL